MIKDILKKLDNKNDLSKEEMQTAVESIMTGKVKAEIYEGIWIDTGTIDRLELANKTHKDEN